MNREKYSMLAPGLAKKVTIHLNEDTCARHDFLYSEIFAFLRENGVAGATLIRPAAGFGSHHRTHSTEGDEAERQHLPVRIEFIESRSTADALLPALCELITDGLIEAHDTTVIKAAAREEPA
jgi:PII-like signaling protein